MGDSLQENVPVGVHVCLCVGVNTTQSAHIHQRSHQ